MIQLPKYQPHQWVIVDGDDAFAQIINGYEKPEGGWSYRILIDGEPAGSVEEDDILACLEDGKWIKKAVITTQNVYSK